MKFTFYNFSAAILLAGSIFNFNNAAAESNLRGPSETSTLMSSSLSLRAHANEDESISCPLPRFDPSDGRWRCINQQLTLEQRRELVADMQPFDEINGEKLDETWPATAGKTTDLSHNPYRNGTMTDEYDHEGVIYMFQNLVRPEGERTPIHYHETPQMFCLRQGKILVKREGYPDTMYEPPACYVMEAYIKMATISLVGDKVEDCLLRKQHGDFNWVVLEPDYLHLQNQWWS